VIEPAFRIILTQHAATAALVTDRIHFGVSPQNERRPRIVLTLVSSVPAHTFDGSGGYTRGRMQIDCLAPSYPAAKDLAAAARAALDNTYSKTVDGTAIDYIEADVARDIPMAPPVGAELPTTYGVSFDCRFQHQGI